MIRSPHAAGRYLDSDPDADHVREPSCELEADRDAGSSSVSSFEVGVVAFTAGLVALGVLQFAVRVLQSLG